MSHCIFDRGLKTPKKLTLKLRVYKLVAVEHFGSFLLRRVYKHTEKESTINQRAILRKAIKKESFIPV